MDRRNSKDGEPPRPPANPDVFDDEYALDPDEDDFMPSVSDGFRPANATDAWSSDRRDTDHDEPPRPPLTTTKSADTDLRRIATRNSTAKVPFPRESVVQDGRNPATTQRGLSSQATPSQHQHRESVSSTASFATTTPSESPFGNAPSHPYGMYPQHTMTRNSSIATTSTQPQPQRSLSLQRPTHPYGMYPQNVVVEDEPPMPQVQNAIPVGFPGINTGFHRQLGPDGEEQDIIGPDGHTEQLPPYSRYPEEGPTKASMAAEASATPVEPVPNPMAASNDALLTNVAPPSPVSPVSPLAQVAHVAPALLPQQRPETQTGSVAAPRPATTSESASLLTTSDDEPSEKVEVARSVKKTSWRSKRLWGKVPITVALLLLILLLIFAVVLGAAIGTFVAKNKDKSKDNGKNHNPNKNDPQFQNTGDPNSLFDATPITTPTSLLPLPTGQFSLPLGYAQESSPGCLTQGNQYSAWSCKMTFTPLILTINSTSETSHNASIKAFVAPDGSIQYGLQSPLIDNVPLQLVSDLDYKGYGPAWHFAARYNKIVYLTPDEFAAGSGLRSRQDKPFRHRFQVQPGDNPWQCVWNQTYIEGYIYVLDNSTAATMTSYPTPSTDPFASAFSGSGASPTPAITGSPTTASTPTPTGNNHRRDDPGPFARLPPYPRIVKIEERRLPGSPQPYCQKMTLLENGQLAQATNSNGATVMVWLQEQDPTRDEYLPPPPNPSSSANATERKRRAIDKRRDPSDACHCQWMFQ